MKITSLFATGVVLVALLVGAARAQTPPPGHSAEWNAGYTAGWTAATQPIPPEPPPSNQPIDLAPIVKSAKDGSTVVLNKNGNYYLKSQCVIEKSITLDGNGSTLECPASGETFHSTKSRTLIKNLTIKKCGIFFGNWADSCALENITLGKDQPNGSIGQVCKTGPGGTNTIIRNCYWRYTNTVGFYTDRDGFTVENCEMICRIGRN